MDELTPEIYADLCRLFAEGGRPKMVYWNGEVLEEKEPKLFELNPAVWKAMLVNKNRRIRPRA